MPEWIGTVLFLVAVGLTATKLNDDFRENGIFGYLILFIMIGVYAGAIGSAFA
jgi:hypothetical protein